MSQTAARPAPPPSAAPWIRPMSGTGSVVERANIAASACASRRFSASRVADGARHPLRVGAGAEDRARPGEHHDAHLVSSRRLRQRAAHAVSSAIICSLNALRTSGRLRVRYSTAPSRLCHVLTKIVDYRVMKTEAVEPSVVLFRASSSWYAVCHILKTPNLGAGIGALNAADSPRASAWRVFAGSRMPSSHSRAVE